MKSLSMNIRAAAKRKLPNGKQEAAMTEGETLVCEKSVEYAARIIAACALGKSDKIHGNVVNRGLIDNLPENACVEVPCLVDGEGLRPQKVARCRRSSQR